MSAYRIVPRLRNLADRRLATIGPLSAYKGLEPVMPAGRIGSRF